MAINPVPVGKRTASGLGAASITTAMVLAVAHYAAPKTAQFEGFVSCPYVDKVGRGHPLTVGYGHTGPDVKSGRCISQAEAVALLEQDEQKAARKVASCSPQYVVDSKSLWGAGTDFALNTGYYCRGPGGKPTTMARLFSAGRPAEACRFFNQYVYAAGTRLRGLIKRRAYFSGDCAKGIPDEFAR